MISEADQIACTLAGLSFILGTKIPFVLDVVSRWRQAHPGQDIADGHVFTQPRPATSSEKARGIAESGHLLPIPPTTGRGAPCAASTSKSPKPRKLSTVTPRSSNRFDQAHRGGEVSQPGSGKAKARGLAGLKCYTTNLTGQDRRNSSSTPITSCGVSRKSFRMSKHDLQARPVYHHKRESIDAHLAIVFAARSRRWPASLPAASGTPAGPLAPPRLARHAAPPGSLPRSSASTIWRWLADDALKPWQHRSWIFPRDPHFAAQGRARPRPVRRGWEGEPLGPDDYVVSADEKTSIQARSRRHHPLPAGPGRGRCGSSTSTRRGGALAYLAAWDVQRAGVIGRCEPTTGIAPFGALVDQVMASEPYASARRVFWVVDNGSSHRGQAAVDRLQDACPTSILVHLPIHASWLNQIEIYFSIVQRKVLTPNDFPDLAAVDAQIPHSRPLPAVATPFDWKFTTADLKRPTGPHHR